ncbi:MAG: DNA polymerase clamp loader subunit A [Clostridia bacterium]|jgi:hypothetical protein
MKKQQDKNKQQKTKGLFDHINGLTASDPKYFKKLSDSEKKSFSIYMVNRVLSMHPDLIEAVNYFQKFNHMLDSEIVFRLYYDILPKKRMYLKYVKAMHEVKYNKDIVDFLVMHYRISTDEAKDHLKIYLSNDFYKTELIRLLQAYGYDLQKIQELVK